MKTENMVLSRIKETDPITYQELLELQKYKPGMFSRIISAAIWALVGAGLGKVFADQPEVGALAGGILGTLKKQKEIKDIDKQITEIIVRSNATRSPDYQHERPINYTPNLYIHRNKKRNPFDGSPL